MYTGTLIKDLVAAVEHVEMFGEFRIQQTRMAERLAEEELQRVFAIQAAQENRAAQVYAGAA